MFKNSRRDNGTALEEIRKNLRLLNVTVAFVIATLIAVIVRYLYEPLFPVFEFLPDISVKLVVGIVFFLALVGIYLFFTISKQTTLIIEDHSGKLEKMLAITKDLREEVHSDILLEKLMNHALSITGSEAGSILMIEKGDEKEKGLRFKVAGGEKGGLLAGNSIEAARGIAGWVAETGRPLCVADVSRDERFNPEVDAKTGFQTRSVLCVPLKATSGVVGVIELLNKKDGSPFRKRDEEVITYLADQAAVSITTAKFYEDQNNYQIHLTQLLLEAIDFQIPEKEGHSRRVATYSNIIARALDMSDEEKKKLHFACLLHDVGFLKIKAEDVFKKEAFVKHPVIGYEMIRPITFYSDIAPFILHHHERYDGFGYPTRLKGEEIPREARIIFIAEAFDAMISESSYRIPLGLDEAKEEIRRNAGSQFDPVMAGLFLENLPANLFNRNVAWADE